MPSPVLIVANPIAGRGHGEAVAHAVAQALRRAGNEVDLRMTRARGDAQRWAHESGRGARCVVSVGGDGTLREVFEGLDEHTPVALAPLGTANVLSIDLKLPRAPEAIAQLVLAGRTQALDVGRANGALSFLVTGVGLDAAAVAEVERVRRGPITKLAYVGAMLRALRDYAPPQLEVELDGRRVEGPVGMLLISNVIHYAGSFHLSPQRRLDDGAFEVYLFRDGRRFALGCAAARAWFSSLPGGACELRRARSVLVRSDALVPYHVDGDRGGATPLEFEVCGQRRVIVP